MRKFVAEHQEDAGLRPKDQGGLMSRALYHMGREDTFEDAVKLLRQESDTNAAGMFVLGVKGTRAKISAIDYLEAVGVPVDTDYWGFQAAFSEDPRYWADWAIKRDSGLLSEIIDSWQRENSEEALIWIKENFPEKFGEEPEGSMKRAPSGLRAGRRPQKQSIGLVIRLRS